MATAACPYTAEILRLLRQQVDPDRRPALEGHLVECPACRDHFRAASAGWLPSVPNYTVIERVGEGGFGVVYKAVHHAKQRIEALKMLFGRSPTRDRYFHSEVKLIAGLRHPNIATLFEARLDEPPLFYTLEFVEGLPLHDWIQRTSPSLQERARIVQTIARAIDYAHERGVVHRDLKPANILIDSERQPRIVDFGIAKKLGLHLQEPSGSAGTADPTGATTPEGLLGTLGYISPEQMAGQPVDGRADVFALGALLFHCLTGEPARYATQPDLVLRLLRARRIARAEDLAAIIAKSVAREPDARYTSCAALAEDIENYLQVRPVAAHGKQTVSRRLSRIFGYVLHRYPAPIAAITVGLLIALLAIGIDQLRARRLAPISSTPIADVALIGFSKPTLARIEAGDFGPLGVTTERHSWRRLHGRLMERLAAAQPRVVVFDYHFRVANSTHDPAFVTGARSLGAPLIVGARFDPNGDPVLSPQIHSAAQAVAALDAVRPDYDPRGLVIPVAFQRQLAPPVPSLALAAYAAARHPDCAAHVELAPNMRVFYRTRPRAEKSGRWLSQTERFRLHRLDSYTSARPPYAEGDRVGHALFPYSALDRAPEAVELADALEASDNQLKTLFTDRVVLVGQMLGDEDRHALPGGSRRYGCEIQVAIMDAMLRGALYDHLSRVEILARVAVLVVAGALCAASVRANQLPHSRGARLLYLAGLVAGALLTAYSALWITDRWRLEIGLAVGCLLSGLAWMAWLRASREAQLHSPAEWRAASRPTTTTQVMNSPGSAASAG